MLLSLSAMLKHGAARECNLPSLSMAQAGWPLGYLSGSGRQVAGAGARQESGIASNPEHF